VEVEPAVVNVAAVPTGAAVVADVAVVAAAAVVVDVATVADAAVLSEVVERPTAVVGLSVGQLRTQIEDKNFWKKLMVPIFLQTFTSIQRGQQYYILIIV
jgi:hypothetical protein